LERIHVKPVDFYNLAQYKQQIMRGRGKERAVYCRRALLGKHRQPTYPLLVSGPPVALSSAELPPSPKGNASIPLKLPPCLSVVYPCGAVFARRLDPVRPHRAPGRRHTGFQLLALKRRGKKAYTHKGKNRSMMNERTS
jgi:hypothetical protein